MRAFEKFCEEKARNQSVFWTGVLTGSYPATVCPSDFGVKMSTMASQAREEGFRTSKWNDDELQIYR